MDTHPIQASPQRWIVALGLLLVAGVQGLFLWGYTDDGIWVSLLDGMAATLLFALSAYWAWYVLGFVHISITTLFITILGISCTWWAVSLSGGSWSLLIMQFYTPFILTLPFRLCYVALLWSIILLWYRLQSAAGERERWKINW